MANERLLICDVQLPMDWASINLSSPSSLRLGNDEEGRLKVTRLWLAWQMYRAWVRSALTVSHFSSSPPFFLSVVIANIQLPLWCISNVPRIRAMSFIPFSLIFLIPVALSRTLSQILLVSYFYSSTLVFFLCSYWLYITQRLSRLRA